MESFQNDIEEWEKSGDTIDGLRDEAWKSGIPCCGPVRQAYESDNYIVVDEEVCCFDQSCYSFNDGLERETLKIKKQPSGRGYYCVLVIREFDRPTRRIKWYERELGDAYSIARDYMSRKYEADAQVTYEDVSGY